MATKAAAGYACAYAPLEYCAALFLSWNSLKRFDKVVYTSANINTAGRQVFGWSANHPLHDACARPNPMPGHKPHPTLGIQGVAGEAFDSG